MAEAPAEWQMAQRLPLRAQSAASSGRVQSGEGSWRLKVGNQFDHFSLGPSLARCACGTLPSAPLVMASLAMCSALGAS